VSLSLEDSGAVVRISDNGKGMSSDELSTIFEMFAQGDQSATRGTGGLGIGLTLTKRLVEMHGGDIVAESSGVGNGSVFVCKLPMTPFNVQQEAGDRVAPQ